MRYAGRSPPSGAPRPTLRRITGSEVGRQIIRGVLGGILGKRR
jgi:hypothetical protein